MYKEYAFTKLHHLRWGVTLNVQLFFYVTVIQNGHLEYETIAVPHWHISSCWAVFDAAVECQVDSVWLLVGFKAFGSIQSCMKFSLVHRWVCVRLDSVWGSVVGLVHFVCDSVWFRSVLHYTKCINIIIDSIGPSIIEEYIISFVEDWR